MDMCSSESASSLAEAESSGGPELAGGAGPAVSKLRSRPSWWSWSSRSRLAEPEESVKFIELVERVELVQ